MAAIDAASAVVTVRQTTTNSAYTDIPGATIADTEFLAGERYLLLVTGVIDLASNSVNLFARTLHGSTVFDDSVFSLEPSTNERAIYPWFTVWTAVAGEGIKVQFKNDDGVTVTGADNIVISAIRLSQLVEGTDWIVASNTTPTGLTTTFQSGASITFTPAVAAQNWLILTLAQVSGPSGANAVQSRQSRSGEATSTDPTSQIEGEDPTNDVQLHLLGAIYTLGASSNTFTEQVRTISGTTGSRIASRVFAINVSAFRSASTAYTAAQVDFTASGAFGDQTQTTSLAPAVTGSVLCLGSFLFVPNGLGLSCNARLQIDNADVPPTQTADGWALQTSADAADVSPVWFHTISTLDTSSHTLDVDASMNTATAGRGYKNRLAVMLLLETTATAATTTGGGAYFFRRSRDR